MARPHNPTGGPRTPEGKAKALKNLTPGNYIHGLYLKDFKADLTEEEKAWYKETFEHYQEKYELDKLDLETLDLALINLIKARRKNVNMEYAVNEKVSVADFESRYIRLIDELGLSRKYRLSKGNIENPNSFDPSILFNN
ncbi:hypothetical protein [Bacillus mycoides]|uniref:hypothetical protein n=1 Tax=Bacillus mycoides TaxID=1405 RepID=UPI0024AD7A34|nr:hypothetical protein [Bacillus mycoides]MDI6531631.1 hypothetical protein [Bacillus mycoides]WJE59664.1 hypothetical protein QRE64_06505 [Bacillus mycoides]